MAAIVENPGGITRTRFFEHDSGGFARGHFHAADVDPFSAQRLEDSGTERIRAQPADPAYGMTESGQTDRAIRFGTPDRSVVGRGEFQFLAFPRGEKNHRFAKGHHIKL